MNTSEQTALQTVRERFLFLQTGAGAPASAADILRPAVGELDARVDGFLERQIWDPADPEHGNSAGRSLTPAHFGGYFAQALRVATAWGCPFSRHYQSAHVLERLTGSLQFGEKFVRPDQPRDAGWHMWDVDHPYNISRILLISGDALPADLRARLLADLAGMPSKVFEINRERGIVRPPIQSGTNNLTILYLVLMRALVTNDPQWLTAANAQIPIAMGPTTGSEGLQSDWSYQFHGHGVNAAYGLSGLCVQAQWIYLLQGTPWEVPTEQRQLHVSMLREFFARNIWRGKISLYTIDRGVLNEAFYSGLTLVAVLYGTQSRLPAADQAMFDAAAADFMLSLDRDGKPIQLSSIRVEYSGMELLAGLLLSRLKLPVHADLNLLDGMRYYPESEYLIVREPNWYAAVRMSSGRTSTWKSMLGQHTQGSSSAEFSIVLMTDGREFDYSTIVTMNWKRLMGVTRCDAIEPPPEGYGQSTFCRGVAGDEFSVLGLQYLLAPAGQGTLRANKSLFLTPEALVLLGSQIRCDSDEPVVTTLFHAPLITDGPYQRNGTPLPVEQDGVWELKAGETVFLRNVGIQLLTDAQLIVETRRGSPADLTMAQCTPAEPKDRTKFFKVDERRWVYLVVNHGVRPKTGRYGAIIYPGITPATMPAADHLQISHGEDHHIVSLQNGALGGEVRFPGDWRRKIGSSYWGAEQHQWGSLARWLPADDAEHARLEITAPRRFIRKKEANTEIMLPDRLAMENVTLKTYAGALFPANLLSIVADGQVHTHRVRRLHPL